MPLAPGARLGPYAIDLTGTPGGVAETVLHGPTDHSGAAALRSYIWCLPGDGADATIVVTTSGAAVADAAAIEVSGASCTEDGTSQAGENTAMAHGTAMEMTTTVNGSILFGLVTASGAADFSAGTNMTSVPTGNGDIGAGPNTQGEYYITTTAGANGFCPATSAANETTLAICAGVQPAAATTTPKGPLVGILP